MQFDHTEADIDAVDGREPQIMDTYIHTPVIEIRPEDGDTGRFLIFCEEYPSAIGMAIVRDGHYVSVSDPTARPCRLDRDDALSEIAWRAHDALLTPFGAADVDRILDGRDLSWIVPPACAGQIVEYAYSRGTYDGIAFERTTDRSARVVSYRRIDLTDAQTARWDPANGRID